MPNFVFHIVNFLLMILFYLSSAAGLFIMMTALIKMLSSAKKDIITKMHVLATGESLGFCLVILGLIFYHMQTPLGAKIILSQKDCFVILKLIIISIMFWLSNAVSTHNLAKIVSSDNSHNNDK